MTVSLVGYTNAGKSTLFNALTKARSYAADQLFATLDTTTRQLYLENASAETAEGWVAGHTVSLSDTVGFIRDLPHGLIEAFEATLQEAAEADLLLHVVDAANPAHLEQITEVRRVLHEIGAADVPQWLIFNKLDALPDSQRPRSLHDSMEIDGQRQPRLFVSAGSGQGLGELRLQLAAWAQRMAESIRHNPSTAADDPRPILHSPDE